MHALDVVLVGLAVLIICAVAVVLVRATPPRPSAPKGGGGTVDPGTGTGQNET